MEIPAELITTEEMSCLLDIPFNPSQIQIPPSSATQKNLPLLREIQTKDQSNSKQNGGTISNCKSPIFKKAVSSAAKRGSDKKQRQCNLLDLKEVNECQEDSLCDHKQHSDESPNFHQNKMNPFEEMLIDKSSVVSDQLDSRSNLSQGDYGKKTPVKILTNKEGIEDSKRFIDVDTAILLAINNQINLLKT